MSLKLLNFSKNGHLWKPIDSPPLIGFVSVYENGFKKGNFRIGNEQIGYSFLGGLYIDIVSSLK